MKKILNFIKHYYLFVIALVVSVLGLFFQFYRKETALHWSLGVVAIAEVMPLLWNMWKDIREGTYGIDVLAATAIVTSVILQQYWAAIIIVIMLTGGEALEDFAEGRAKTELSALLSRVPKMAHRISGKNETDVLLKDIKVKDKLVIRPGEVVPVDAQILEGQASFDESSLTGESAPQLKQTGDQLLSGSLNIDGVVTVVAIRVAAESQYEQIIKLVRGASNSKAPFVRLADRYSIPFTIVAFVLAIGAWILSHESIRFLDVLVVATPCPLILAAPIAIISGMSRAAKQGIIIKTGSALERLAEAETFAFDKTGTLTEGRPKVDTIITYNNFKKSEIISIAAALEQGSNHVLAAAVTNELRRLKLKTPRVKNIKEVSGLGISGTTTRGVVIIGRRSFLESEGIAFPSQLTEKKATQATATFVAIAGKPAGIIMFKDELRAESKETLHIINQEGVKHLLMVTGDNKTVASAIAKKLGIDIIEADALPADKLRIIEHVDKAKRPVVFVGDGVNDAPVLMASDVGIALGAKGETAASESADMVIMLDDLSRVAAALVIAKRTFFIARQSILIGIALSIILMLIFATGYFKPVYGAVIQELVDVIVIINALRVHSGNLGKKYPTLNLRSKIAKA